MEWILTCVLMFAAGFAASVYSWPTISDWIREAKSGIDRLREWVARIAIRLKKS